MCLAKNGANPAGHGKQAPSTAALKSASICLHSSGSKHMLAQGTCQMQVILALNMHFLSALSEIKLQNEGAQNIPQEFEPPGMRFDIY